MQSRGIRRLVAGGVSTAIALAVSTGAWAYGHRDRPVGGSEGFGFQGGDHRVVGLYRQDSHRLGRDVSLPSGTGHVRVQIDCVGSGAHGVRVELHAAGDDALTGQAWLPCHESSRPGDSIGLDARHELSAPQRTRVTVAAPSGAHWSVVVDAGPGKRDRALDLPAEASSD